MIIFDWSHLFLKFLIFFRNTRDRILGGRNSFVRVVSPFAFMKLPFPAKKKKTEF